MRFETQQNTSEQLSRGDYLEVAPSLRVWFFYLGMFFSALGAKLIFLSELPDFEWIWKFVVVGGVAILGCLYLRLVNMAYYIDSREIVGRSGILARTETRVPLVRITNYYSKSGPIERLLGVADVLIDTPGSSEIELHMHQLRLADAKRISDKLNSVIGMENQPNIVGGIPRKLQNLPSHLPASNTQLIRHY